MSTTNQVANGATTLSVTTGAMGTAMSFTQWVAENVIVITVSCTVLSLVIALIFHILNTIINKNRVKIQKAQMTADFKSKGKTVEEINEILKMSGL